MNSGLPSLLGAIFGKRDLASVSLDEMYEVINEFPSFNAAHFFLSKKLKQQDDAAYEGESMRTALYFNNAFWLQSILEEGNHSGPAESTATHNEEEAETSFFSESINESITGEIESPVYEFTSPTVITEFTPEINPPPLESNQPDAITADYGKGTITSFDELISKYKIEEFVDESPAEMSVEPEYRTAEPAATEMTEELPIRSHEEEIEEIKAESTATEVNDLETAEIKDESAGLLQDQAFGEVEQESPGMVQFEELPEPDSKSDSGQFEIREEVLNEYGIFEEVVVKKPDYDLDAFDRQIESISPAESVPVEIQPLENLQRENESIVENHYKDEASDKSDAGDYEAFDRPLENIEYENTEPIVNPELNGFQKESNVEADLNSETDAADADDTGDPEHPFYSRENEPGDRLPDSASRLQEHQKPAFTFDTKKAESIVFAPYHMIDYFASQGIKLVLEDNPADSFGKQLKSFTDWLKVMKKLPAKPESGKTDEQEADRIRHFAAHSIEERDILTESMAEVLAKQGMYENAIALYQKLSLIYPPKSAYFASRIEQIKASLP
jgi:hypothetical protein